MISTVSLEFLSVVSRDVWAYGIPRDSDKRKEATIRILIAP